MNSSSTQYKTAAWLVAPMLACSLTLAACGSSDNGSAPLDDDPVPANAAEPSLTFQSLKTFRFSWTDVSDASHYKLLENSDGISGFTQVGSDVLQGVEHIDYVVPLYARTNAQYILQSCTISGCVDSNEIAVSGTLVDSIGYVKASNTDVNDNFGASVTLSGDGNTLAVSALGEDSNATGVNGNQLDNSLRASAAVYVFVRDDNSWKQQAYIKASNTAQGGSFGDSISLSKDGNTLAVSATGESSNATGINSDQSDNLSEGSGAVYVFNRSSVEWSQTAYLKASNTEAVFVEGPDNQQNYLLNDHFGSSVSLSLDGKTLAVGAFGEDSNAKGINGDQQDNSAKDAGAAYVFVNTGDIWIQQAYIKASNADAGDLFGGEVSLSADGDTMVVAALGEDSGATGINGGQRDNSASTSGAAYVFTRSGSEWNQQAYIKASNTDEFDYFGGTVRLSADGRTLAIGAAIEQSNATGVNSDQSNNTLWNAGAVYIFFKGSEGWEQHAYLKASNTWGDQFFGSSVSLSADGNLLAVGANRESSYAIGINGDQTDQEALHSGAVYIFVLHQGEWNQIAYLKPSNTDRTVWMNIGGATPAYDYFGGSVSLSSDGSILAVGAQGEDSDATGVNGDRINNSAEASGAVYLF